MLIDDTYHGTILNMNLKTYSDIDHTTKLMKRLFFINFILYPFYHIPVRTFGLQRVLILRTHT